MIAIRRGVAKGMNATGFVRAFSTNMHLIVFAVLCRRAGVEVIAKE
ncbi:hypothetical protein [Pirellula sp. SH-Sr6A]|nr:hypothetical protein [Pirellula sp. SH-Sr6A]